MNPRTLPLLAAACLLLAAATPPPALLSPADTALADQAKAYLQALTSAKGHFAQVDARGHASAGTFTLQRPGRARFDYDPPSRLTIASDGHSVTVVDGRLKTIQSYPLGATPLSLFLAKQIRLDRGVVVSQVIHTDGGFTLIAKDAHKKTQGQIALNFAASPLSLTGWAITEPQGATTRVHLTGLSATAAHEQKFFEIWRPN